MSNGKWKSVSIGEVCDFLRGLTYKKADEVEFSSNVVLRANNIALGKGVLNFDEIKYIRDDIKIADNKFIKKNSVLLCTASGSKSHLGKTAFIDDDYEYAFGGFMGLLRPKPELDGKYLYWVTASKAYSDFIVGLSDGANINNLKFSQLSEFSFPLPPIDDQKRIVAILDEAFAGIDAAIANTEKNLANARELFESYLDNIFTQRGSGWIEEKVGNIAKHRLGKMLDKNKNKGDFKPYLRNLNVQWFNIQTDDVLEMRFEEEEYEKYQVLKGDLLICEGGYPGRAAIWENDASIFFQKALHRVRCKEPKYNRWLLYFLFLSDANGNLKQYYTGAGIQHFTGQSLKKLVVPIPPSSQIDGLLEKFELLHNQTRQLKSIYQQKINALNELKQSLLQKAFSGELTSAKKIAIPKISAIETVTPQFTASVIALAYYQHALKKRDKTFGRVKAQKTLHLVESIAGIDLGRIPIKDAAGPNDFPHMLRAEEWAKSNQFFAFKKRTSSGGYDFIRLENFDTVLEEAQTRLGDYAAALEGVVELVLPMDSSETEVFATVHAAWNNLVFDGVAITEEAILREARDNWHADKQKISESKFHDAIRLIRDKGLEPQGQAKRVGGQDALFV